MRRIDRMSAVLLGDISSFVQKLEDRLTGSVELSVVVSRALSRSCKWYYFRNSLLTPFPVGLIATIAPVRHPNIDPCGLCGLFFRLVANSPRRSRGVGIGIQHQSRAARRSMSRAEAIDVVRQRGGRPSPAVTKGTQVLIVGELGWPLLDDGRPSNKLSRATVLGIPIVSERRFLEWVGRSPSDNHQKTYSADQLAALSKMSTSMIKELAQLSLLDERDGRFGFRDLASARQIAKLLNDGVRLSEIIRAPSTAGGQPHGCPPRQHRCGEKEGFRPQHPSAAACQKTGQPEVSRSRQPR